MASDHDDDDNCFDDDAFNDKSFDNDDFDDDLMTVILMTVILMKMVGLPQGQFSTDTWDKITHTQERTRSFKTKKKQSNYSPILNTILSVFKTEEKTIA